MTGGSYFGHTQWAVAPYVDPPLVSISPHITAARITTAFYDHGAPLPHTALTWSAEIGRQEAGGLPESGLRFRRPAARMQHRTQIDEAGRQVPPELGLGGVVLGGRRGC